MKIYEGISQFSNLWSRSCAKFEVEIIKENNKKNTISTKKATNEKKKKNGTLSTKKKENKIQRSKELWEELKSYGTPFSPKLLFII